MARAMRRAEALGAVLISLSVVFGAAAFGPDPAGASEQHHAAVIVDTGTTVHRVLITFSEDSISGIAALQRAGANPAVLSYNGVGGAVCALYGVGHAATSASCLGDANDHRYWAYFTNDKNPNAFSYSAGGAGSTKVRDGSVQGWKYETGSTPPPFASVADLTPPQPATTPPPASTTHPGGAHATAGSSGTPSGGAEPPAQPPVTPGPSGRSGVVCASPCKTATSAPKAASPTLPTAGGAAKPESRRDESVASATTSAAKHKKGSSGGAPAASLAMLALILALFAAVTLWIRRRRVMAEKSSEMVAP
jgi:hypothetical protein